MLRIAERLTGRQGWPWMLLLFIAPFAYIAGGLGLARWDQTAAVDLGVTRDDAIAIARHFVSANGLPGDKANALVRLEVDNSVRRYAASHKATMPLVTPLAPPVRVHVFLTADKNRAGVLVSREGKVVGWDLGKPPKTSATATVPPGRAAAEALSRQFGAASVATFQFEGSSKENDGRQVFTWRRRFAQLPGLSVRFDVAVRNGRVTAVNSENEVADAAVRGNTASVRRILIVFAFLLMVGYVIAQFVRRMREQEVPVARSIVIAVAVAVLLSLNTAFLLDDARAGDIDNQLVVAALIVLAMIVFGVCVGITWGACEGDVREVYPSKLSTFDALLAGRVQTRLVARSVIVGFMFGGVWMLCAALSTFVVRNGYYTVNSAAILMSRALTLAAIVGSMGGGPLLAGFGLLIPVSLLHRWIKSPRTIGIAAAVLFCAMQALISLSDASPVSAGVLATTLQSVAIVLPFFAADLLGMLVANAVGGTAALAVYMLRQPAAGFHFAGLEVMAFLFVIAAGAMVTALFGREIAGENLAPRYAANITERLSLQAELAASKQAQLRILPRQLPHSDLVSIAAECRSLDAEGSDYYDIIDLGGGRLGVVLASCTAPGLSAALTVTLLKGLMISYAKRWTSPFEVLTRVRGQLAGILGSGLHLSIFYGVLDPRERVLDLARLGSAPLVLTVAAARPGRVLDSEPLREDGEGDLRITEARATFAASETLVISNAPPQHVRPDDLTTAAGEPSAAILSALLHRAARRPARTERKNDFSAIVISMTSPAAAVP